MSIKVSNLVWASGITPPSTRLVLLCLADLASDDGGRLWPSMATIARRCQISDRQAQRIMKSLIDGGIVEVLKNATGGPPGHTPNYRICLERFPGVSRNGTEQTGDTHDAFGDTHDATGDTHDAENVTHVTQTITPTNNRHNGYLVGGMEASGPSGDGLAPTPRAEAPGGVDADLWAAIAARPAFRKSPAALEALAGEVSKAHAAGETPEVLARRLGVLLEPERQHLTRLPFDPAPVPKAKKQLAKYRSRNALVQTRGLDFGSHEKDYS